jgi:hypothetical protein
MTEQLFDVTAVFRDKLPRPEGILTVTLKFPTDEQWIERSRRRKIRQRNLGNGKVQSITMPPDHLDLELIDSLKEDKDAQIDVHEAKRLLERLSTVTMDEEPTREGSLIRIPMRAHGINTVHFLRVPTERDRYEFIEFSGVPTVSRGSIDTYGFNLGAAKPIYAKLCEKSIGYAGAVPISHMLAAINAAFDFIDREIEGDDVNP